MKKKYALLLVFLLASFTYAFEWGGVLSDDTKLNTNLHSLDFHQSNNVSIWANIPFNNSGTVYLSSQGSAKYYWDISKEENKFTPILNLDLLKFTIIGNFGASGSTFAMGRFNLSDLTGKVFSQASDGMLLELSFPVFNLGFYAGFTGLLNTAEVYMLDSKSFVYSKAPSFVPVCLTYTLPSLFLNQQFAVQTMSFIDLAHPGYTRNYATLSLKGPISGFLSYSLNSCFGSEKFSNITNLSDFTISFVPNQTISLSVNATYASGKLFFLSPFVGFTSHTAYNSIYSPELSGVLLPSLSMQYFSQSFCTLLNIGGVFDMPAKNITFKGIDGSVTILFNIYSDLQLSFKSNVFYDLASKTDSETNFVFDIGAIIVF